MGPPTLGEITVDGRTIRAVHAAEQDRVPVRLRPRYWRAGVADRGASGAAIDGARRAGVPDPAVPDSPAAVRAPGRRRGRPDRLHGRAGRARPRGRRPLCPRAPVHPAHRRRRRAGRHRRHPSPCPGSWGSGNWNTGAFDPETGLYYAFSHVVPRVYRLADASWRGERGDGLLQPQPRRAVPGRHPPREAAVGPHHRHRPQPRRAGMAGGQRPGAARPSRPARPRPAATGHSPAARSRW